MCGWAWASLTSAPRVDEELPPRAEREPKPEYGDFHGQCPLTPRTPGPPVGPEMAWWASPGLWKTSWEGKFQGGGWVGALALWPCPGSQKAAGCISGLKEKWGGRAF